MSEIHLQTKNIIQIFVVNPKEFSKLSSSDFDILKDLLLKINTESENNETNVDQINTLSLSLELIKIIVLNNFPCNFESLFKCLIEKAIDAIQIKSARCASINVLLKLIEEDFISNEKYMENNRNTIKKMNIIIEEENKIDIKDVIKSLRKSVKENELNLYLNTESNCENKMITDNLSISSTKIQEGLTNIPNKADNSKIKMSKSENMKFHSKLTNGLFVKMIMKLYKDSNGGKVVTKCLENDFQLPLIISENTENNYLMEIIENVEISDDKKDSFDRVDKYFSEIHDILIIVQLMKYFSLDIENLDTILSIFLSVVTASYMHLLSSLINKKCQESNEEAATISSLEFLNKFILEISIMFENLHMNKPLIVFGTMNILVFHKFIKEVEKNCAIEYWELMHNNQDFLLLSRTVLQKLTNLINSADKESELNWKLDSNMGRTSNLTDLLKISSRNWLCIILKDNNLKIMLFWLERLFINTAQMITYLNEQNTLASQTGPMFMLYIDYDAGPGEESRNDNQKLAVQFVSEILKTISFLLMNEDPVIHDLIFQQLDKQAFQSVVTLASLLDEEIFNLREAHSNNDLNELTQLFVNFIDWLFSFEVISECNYVNMKNRHHVMKPVDEEKLKELVIEIFKNKVFHDPIRKVKPTEIKKEEIEISGEQSKLSLADDILKAINNPEEHLRLKGDAHDGIRRDMKMLFDELDTLFHHPTIPIKPETEIEVLGEALAVDGMEEVDVAGLTVAPKKVFRELNINVMKGQNEGSKLDRKRKKKVEKKENKNQKTHK